MKSSNRHQKHSSSNSHSPSNRSRSRERERDKDKERERERERGKDRYYNRETDRERDRDRDRDKEKNKDRNNNNREHNKHQQHNTSNDLNNIMEGKLYLTNIPINIPEYKVKEEFEKFGKVIDYSLRKKLNIANPYYYGNITLSKKQEADKAREYITKNLSWYVAPFDKDANKDKNNSKNRQKEQNNYMNNKQEIPVREILVKNLPNSTTEVDLYKEFFIYGEISKIELKTGNDNKKYAFIKYRLIASALKACEETKNMNYNGNLIKVNFSNVAQRKDIKGNEEGYILNENNCKLILVTLNNNCQPPDEKTFLKIFEKFGKIKNFAVKISNQNKNCIYIEYYKPEEAKIAIEELNSENNIEDRKTLGDENCEINFYFKTKSHEIKVNPFNYDLNNNMNNINMLQNMNMVYKNMLMQNMAMGMGIGMNNPSIMFQLMPKNYLNNQFNLNPNNNLQTQKQNVDNNINSQTLDKNIENNNNSQNINQTKQPINNQLNNLNLSYPLLNPNFKNQLSKMPFPFVNPSLYPGINYQQQTQESMPNNYPIQNQNDYNISMFLNNPNIASIINNNIKNQNNNINNNLNNLNNNNLNNNNNNNNDGKDVKDLLKRIMDNKNNQNKNVTTNKHNSSDSDISSLNGSQSAEEMDFEKEYSLEEENLTYIWNGFLTKNNKDRVNVDLYKIRGKIDDSYFKEYHLNICNRIQYEEVMKRHLLGIVAISPQNVTQREIFDEYVNYLNEKQRCGVINVSEKYILYLASPGEFSRKFYQNPKKHLLGLLVDATVELNLYNCALPPPVISLTEKRRLMSKAKKQNEAKNENKNENDVIMKLKEELKKNKEEDSDENINDIEEFIKNHPEIKNIFDKFNKQN